MSAAKSSVNIKQGDNIMSIGGDSWQDVLGQVAGMGGDELAHALNEKMRVGLEAFCAFGMPVQQTVTVNPVSQTYGGQAAQPQWQQREPAPQPYSPPVPARSCPHGQMMVKQDISKKNNKPYTRYSCPQGLCEVQWG